MTDQPQLPPCDVCGKPATKSVRDIFRDGTENGYRKYKGGPFRHGCTDHPPAPSQEFDENGKVVKLEFLL